MTAPDRRRPTLRLLDGGLSTALERLGFDTRHELWTARALVDAPELVVAAHRRFVDVGAQMILTASYQAGIANLTRFLGSATRAHEVLASSVALAREAVAGRGPSRVEVAASLGAYGALLADGSEYHGRYPVSWGRVAAEQRERLAVLLDAGPDVVVCETLPTIAEAAVTLEVLDDLRARGDDVTVWLTFTAGSHGLTAGGDRLEQVADLVQGRPWVQAVGVNCTPPGHVEAALAALGGCDRPLIAKPNGGGTWQAATGHWEGASDASAWATLVPRWRTLGVAYLGGCCGVGPEELAAMAAATAASTADP